MFDELRARAEAITAKCRGRSGLRLFFVAFSGLALVQMLSGCIFSSERPDLALDVPPAYRAGRGYSAPPALDWWRGFRSSELTKLIEEAQTANLDIGAAIGRIMQADAQSKIAGAPLLPGVDFAGSATRLRPPGGPMKEDYKVALNASYEIDFWGKNRALLRAAEETAAASRYDREVVGLATVVSAANAYFQVLAAQDRLRVARDNAASASRVLDLIKQRLAAGTASQLDVAQQESLLATQRAAVPPLEQTLKQNRTALAILMGRTPEHAQIRGGSLRGIAYPRVTPGLPSELLAQRPDIREAEANLAAANANVYNARAQFLPSITLTGAAGYESAVLKTLFRPESALYSVAAGLAQPIFEGGRLTGNLDLQKGRQDELLQNYRKAVISAFGDVENALDAIRQTAARERLQAEVVRSSREAFNIAEQRLREGTIDLVTVLQTQQTLYQAEDLLVQARLAHVQAIVSLYQALGGGWLPKPPELADAR